MTPPGPAVGAVLAYVRWALKRSDLSPTARAVALLVASHYNRDEGYARPSWAELGDTLGCDRSTIWRAVRDVTAAGVWRVEANRGRATRYHFPLAAPVRDAHTGRASATGDISTPVASARPTRRASATPPVAPARPERSSERAREQEAPVATADTYPDPRDVRSIIRLNRDAELARILAADDARRAGSTEPQTWQTVIAAALAADDARIAAQRQ